MTVNFAVNYLAVIVAAAATIALGFIWYARPVFGDRWLAYLGKTRAELGQPGPGYALTVVVSLVNAFILALISLNLGGASVTDGIVLGVLVWLGFIATVSAGDFVFSKRPWGLWALNNGYQLIAQVLMGAIVTVWR